MGKRSISLNKIEIPAIRQAILKNSVMTNNLGQSIAHNQLGASTVLQNQLKTSNTSSKNESDVHEQDDHNLRVDGSIYSRVFHLPSEDNNSDNGVYARNSSVNDFDNIGDAVSSNRSDNSDVISRPRDSYTPNEDENQGKIKYYQIKFNTFQFRKLAE